jgi:hypothetical protein
MMVHELLKNNMISLILLKMSFHALKGCLLQEVEYQIAITALFSSSHGGSFIVMPGSGTLLNRTMTFLLANSSDSPTLIEAKITIFDF